MSYSEFAKMSPTTGGASWEIILEDKQGSAANNDLVVMSLVRRVGSQDLNAMNPWMAAQVDLQIFDKNRIIRSRITGSNQEDIRLTVKKGGVVWHRGHLQPYEGKVAISRPDPVINITFDDGIKKAEKNTDTLTDKTRLIQLLRTFVVATDTELDTRVALAFKDTEQNTSTFTRPQAHRIVPEYLDAANKKEEAAEVLKFYNLQAFQEDGKWRILQRSARDSGLSYEWVDVNPAGTTVISNTRNPTVSLSDSDVFELSGNRATESTLAPIGWETSYSRKTNSRLDFQPDNVASLPGPVKRWGEIVIDGIFVDNFKINIDATLDQNGTAVNNDITINLARVMAYQPGSNTRKYWDQSSNSWVNSQTNITDTVNEEPTNTTKSIGYTHTVTTLPSNGEWVLEARVLDYSLDPDNDGQNEVDSVTHNTDNLQDLERNVFEWLVDDTVTRSTTAGAERVSERLELQPIKSSLEKSATLFPHGGIEFKDGRSGEWEPLHQNSEAEHVDRNLHSGTSDLSDLRLRDRYAMTSGQMDRKHIRVERSKVQLRDTIEYDGKVYLPVYCRDDISTSKKEIVMVELLYNPPPTDAIKVMLD